MKKQIIILKVASEAIQHELATSEANAKKMDYHRALNRWRNKNGYQRHKFDGNASCNDKIKTDGRWDEMLESADAEYAEWIKARGKSYNAKRRLSTAVRSAISAGMRGELE